MSEIALLPGMVLWPSRLNATAQKNLLAEVFARIEHGPLYRPTMPRTGTPFTVEMTNFGPLGWVSDRGGYRYQKLHPITGQPWPDMPAALLSLWDEAAGYGAPPEACLVNLYREGARMGLHQDMDEDAPDAPVLSVSLGDSAIFRFGGIKRGGPTRTVKLNSGDVVMFGGPARFLFHGIDRVQAGSSSLVPGGGRINLTLRRVTRIPN
jgi:alkylated DNA repair protein (DNA oxidative demethylase)